MAEVYRVELKFDADERSLKVFVKEMGKGADVAQDFDRSLDIAAEGVSELELRLSSLDKQLDRISKLEGIFRDIAISGVAMAYTGKQILDAYMGLGGQLVEEAAQLELMGALFGVMLGDARKGEEFNRQIDEAVRLLPIFHSEMAQGAMILMNYGVSTDLIIEKFEGIAWASRLARRPVENVVMWVTRLADPTTRGNAINYLLQMGLVVEKSAFFAELSKKQVISVEQAFSEFSNLIATEYTKDIEIYKDTWVHHMRVVEANITRIKQTIGAEFIELLKGPLKEFGDWLVKISTDEKFKEWIRRFTEGLRQMGKVLMWIYNVAYSAFEPIIAFLKWRPEVAGFIVGLGGIAAVLLIVAGGALALFGNFGMLIMSKKALNLEIERYNIEGKIAAATMQTQAGAADGLAVGLSAATTAQSAYNTQLALFNEKQLAATGGVKDFGGEVEGTTKSLGLMALAMKGLWQAYAMYLTLRHVAIPVLDWLGPRVSDWLDLGGPGVLPEKEKKYQEQYAKDLEKFKKEMGHPLFTSKAEKEEWYAKHPEQRPIGVGWEGWAPSLTPAPIVPEDIGVGAGGDGRATETGPQINTYYITQHFEDGSVQILPEGEFDAEGFLTEMEALAPG